MQRTQISITEEQERRRAARAEDAGVPKAEVIRRMLDEALGLTDGAGADERLPPPDPVSTCFDSTILIAHLRGDVRATELLLSAVDEGAIASVISGSISRTTSSPPRRRNTPRRSSP